MPSPIKFAHVVLKTRKYQEMVSWWCEFLEGRVRHGDDFISFISYDDEHHRLAIAAIPGLEDPNPKSAGVEHFVLRTTDIDEVARLHAGRDLDRKSTRLNSSHT